MEKFLIVKEYLKKIRRFGLTGRTVEFKVTPAPENVEPITWIKEAVKEIVTHQTENVEPEDLIGFSFCSKDFSRGEGWIKFKKASETTSQDLWNMIEGIYQSNTTSLGTEEFCLRTTTVRLPVGKGRALKFNNFIEECSKRKGIITINNEDNICLPRALVVAIARIDNDPDFNKIRKDTGKLQTFKALQLTVDANTKIPEEGAGIPELEHFQNYLQDYKIVVYGYGSKGRSVVFEGCTNSDKRLNLLYHENHYNVISSLTAAFACVYFCEMCHIPFDHKNKHRCGGTCAACQQAPKCINDTRIKCDDCNRWFRGVKCYKNHTQLGSLGKSSVCLEVKRCVSCLQTVRNNREHICGEVFCKICSKHQPAGHFCYMQPDNGKPKTKDQLFIFYDLETRQEKPLDNGDLLHEPNLCVFKQCCELCINLDTDICVKCGVRLQTIQCSDPVIPFLHHVLNIRKRFKNVIVIGHNAGGFDHQFILNYILTETDLTPELITRGTRLILMTVGNVKFLDSLNYFPVALSKLPKVFGLQEVKKGYFPHLFNTLKNKNYVGHLPPAKYYGPEYMTIDEHAKFVKWYEENKNNFFDMKKEIVDYCISDVEILTQSCLKFRQLLIEEGNVCPYTEATTLPSACNKIFRRNFLKPDTIGIIPKNGYRWVDNQSKIGIQWLVWEEYSRNINILHAAKNKEVAISGLKVDGYCKETNQIFEFHGCYFHGCPRCFQYKPFYDNINENPEYRYEATVEKAQKLTNQGYEVIEKWECDFRRELQSDETMKSFTETHPLLVNLPLNPRDAFYGGRTEATKMYYKTKPGEVIKYVDICSLYPWVNKYGKYPVGHPQVFVDEECKLLDLNYTEGLIKCKILPPSHLYHPVLPYKVNKRLMFPLCSACCLQLHDEKSCNHNEDERSIIGTWVIDEVRKALEKGYKIQHVYEIWKYETIEYGKEKEGLFSEYINKFLKIKQQASGWPVGCDTQESKYGYIKEYVEKEGVELNPNKISLNPGLRQLGKAVITSFWGKFGQRENQSKTSIINKPDQFFNLMADPAIDINTVLPINDTTLVVNWEYKFESYTELPTVNVCIAAFTTAHARLKLYSYLEKLDKNVLYCDTDSVIYVSRPNEYEVPIGTFLGDMTDELECYGKNSYITEFVSGGPKNYAYLVFTPSESQYHKVCKVKGITLNTTTCNYINFDKLKEMILDDAPPVYICTNQIRRTAEHNVVTQKVKKLYRLQFRKRKIIENYDSLPWGYNRVKSSIQ